jgi:nucleoside-diphosphate-sugar epimerase
VARSGLPWTIVRPPMIYGPRDTEVLKVFKVARSGVVPVFGSRQQELSAIYAPDLAEALVRVASEPGTEGRTYYACHPRVFTSEEFARAVGRAVRRRRVRVVRLPSGLTRGLLGLTGSIARVAGRATILNRDKSRELLQAAWTCDPGLLSRDTGWNSACRTNADTCPGASRTTVRRAGPRSSRMPPKVFELTNCGFVARLATTLHLPSSHPGGCA